MRRILSGVWCCCVLASLAVLNSPAKAGNYYRYETPRATRVWYTSSCCYRKIVRHATTVRYVRIKRSYRPYRASSYRPYRYYRYRYYRPWRYDSARYYDNYGNWRVRSYRYANYLPPPDCRLVRVADIDGSWVWARRAGCF